MAALRKTGFTVTWMKYREPPPEQGYKVDYGKSPKGSGHYDPGKATDADLAPLPGLLDLLEVVCMSPNVSDAGMAYIGRCETLEMLDLMNTKVGDAGVAKLTGLKRLQVLDLTGTNVTDACIPHLKELTSLKQLFLTDTRVTPEGREQLRQVLRGTLVTGNTVANPRENA